jgi:3-phenylpropionate/trans-cinnamate dioxygenase alpha subunit
MSCSTTSTCLVSSTREGGLLDRAVFTEEQLYRQELRRVFAPSWLFLAHTDQFHKPGDFFTTYMGEDPVIVTMTKNREVKAYLNSCRYRGARVSRADFGQTRNFTCDPRWEVLLMP